MNLQRSVDDLMRDNQGAAVVLNANSGEILAISTYPFFDANQLEENWDEWNNSKNSPFLNRASQGAYPIGGLLSPLLLYEQELDSFSNFDNSIQFPEEKNNPKCNFPAVNSEDRQPGIRNGCLSALSQLVNFENHALINKSPQFKFVINPPKIGLPVNPSINISTEANWIDLISGTDQIRTSPLQIAASFTPLSNGGYIVEPMILSSINISSEQWVILSTKDKQSIIKPEKAAGISQLLTPDGENKWELTAVTHDSSNSYSWYVAGTNDSSQETPFVLAVVIETDDREKIQSIGNKIFNLINSY